MIVVGIFSKATISYAVKTSKGYLRLLLNLSKNSFMLFLESILILIASEATILLSGKITMI